MNIIDQFNLLKPNVFRIWFHLRSLSSEMILQYIAGYLNVIINRKINKFSSKDRTSHANNLSSQDETF